MSQAQLIDQPGPVQIATLLGLPRPATFDDLKIADALAAGLPPKSVGSIVRWLSGAGGTVKPDDLVPKSTVHRLTESAKPLGREASERLWRVARVYAAALQLYRNREHAIQFLMRPHHLLDDRAPFDVAKGSSAGADVVVDITLRARFGVPV